jgi:hypothetical protein
MRTRASLIGLGLALMAMSAAAQTVTGSGTTNTVPVFTGTSTVGNSPISVSGGNVGIGETAPTWPLQVNGNIRVNTNNQTIASNIYDLISPGGTFAQLFPSITSDILTIGSGITSGNIIIGNSTMTGNVGIGTPNPGATLDVNGNIRVANSITTSFSDLHLTSVNHTVDIYDGTTPQSFTVWNGLYPNAQLRSDGPSFFYGGGFSVNPTQPSNYWHSQSGSSMTASQSGSNVVTGVGTNWDQTLVGSQFAFSSGQVVGTITSVTSPTSLTVSIPNTVASSTFTINIPGLDVTSAGNVGIGTTAPAQKLEVNGNVQVDGGIYFPGSSTPQTVPYTGITCGGDYAESVDVTGDRKHYEPGDVLVIDPNTPGKFLKSAAPYSTSVSGIYSTKPGTLGRRQTTAQSPDEVPMAVVGIVPAKVSAENGAVHPGDLLVSSSKIGYAMKGTDRGLLTGAVIGKAMGNLDSGTGVIEVLVTLQ